MAAFQSALFPSTPAASASSPRSRAEDGPFSRLPSGTSSLLFPGTASGRSPMLSASPATHVPFTGGAVGAAATPSSNLLGSSVLQPTPASRRPDANPFSPSSYLRSHHAASTPFGAAETPGRGGLATERPPLASMLDAVAPAPPIAVPTPSAVGPPAAETPFSARTPGFAAAATPFAAAAAPPSMFDTGANAAPVGGANAGQLWVTVFGYHTNAMLSAVLDEVRPSGGEIVQHRLGVGPWVHVQFRECRQQQQALSKNGKVLNGVMLGVIEGVVPSEDVLSLPSSSVAGTGMPLKLQLPRAGGPTPTLRAPTAPIRDLGRAGWWTRLSEYIFGW